MDSEVARDYFSLKKNEGRKCGCVKDLSFSVLQILNYSVSCQSVIVVLPFFFYCHRQIFSHAVENRISGRLHHSSLLKPFLCFLLACCGVILASPFTYICIPWVFSSIFFIQITANLSVDFWENHRKWKWK